MPVAQASLDNLNPDNLKLLTQESRVNGGNNSGAIRSNSNLQLADAESILHQIITGAIRYHDGEKVIDIPAREIAQCSVAMVKVIERRRLNLGKANPAPTKEPKRSRSRTMPAVMPAPRREEQGQVAAPAPMPAPAIEPPVAPEPPATA